MNVGLFEDSAFSQLLPLTWIRTAAELSCGRDRLFDKVQTHVGSVSRIWSRPALAEVIQERFRFAMPVKGDDWLLLNTRAMVTGELKIPPVGTAWVADDQVIGVRVAAEEIDRLDSSLFLEADRLGEWVRDFKMVKPPENVRLIGYPWQLPLANAEELKRQCTDGGVDEGKIYLGVHVLEEKNICVEKNAKIKPGAVLDAEDGPIHIAEGALVDANAVIQGPCYIGPNAIVRPGAVIREGVTIGPVCRVGGEVEESILQGYSNKQHDGFLGHSYIANWVNIGADTITSDLKNTYGTVRVFINGEGVESGERFVGSVIGDHAKTGIGTILPTGCVVGFASNVFTQSSTPKFVPSFAWLTDAGMTEYHLEKAVTIAQVVMGRRKIEMSPAETALFEATAGFARDIERGGWE